MTDSTLPADMPTPPALPPGGGAPLARPRRVVRPSVIAPPPVRPTSPADLPRARRVVRPAPRPSRSGRPSRRKDAPRAYPILPLMLTLAAFAGMMAVSFGQGVYALFNDTDVMTLSERQVKDRLVNEMLLFEGMDTVIVVVGILVASRPLARAAAGNRAVAWAAAAPGFLLLLGVNLGYHQFLKWLVSPYQDPNAPGVIDISLKDGWWAILLVCVQPAVVEELFFRYLLFGHLWPHLGVHGAVWVSAVIFGMAHLGNIPGWPVLILLGAGLGYARAYSGTLALPIGLHFLHNLAVLAIDYAVLH